MTTRLEKAIREFDELGSSRVRDDRGYLVVRVPRPPIDATMLWNAFVALVSYATVDELHPAQADAWWAFAYESAVQSGGHAAFLDQYPDSDAAIAALRALGATAHAVLLETARARMREAKLRDQRHVDLVDLDQAAGDLSPTVTEVLERLLQQRSRDFVQDA